MNNNILHTNHMTLHTMEVEMMMTADGKSHLKCASLFAALLNEEINGNWIPKHCGIMCYNVALLEVAKPSNTILCVWFLFGLDNSVCNIESRTNINTQTFMFVYLIIISVLCNKYTSYISVCDASLVRVLGVSVTVSIWILCIIIL